MSSRKLPPWASECLWLESWTQDQFLNLLCGRELRPVAESTEQAIEWQTEKVRADAHVRSAIRTGHLKLLPALTNPRLAQAIAAVDAELAEEIRRASAADQMFGKAYHLEPKEGIRWATQHPGRFPRFPFELPDLHTPDVGHDSNNTAIVVLPHLTKDLRQLFDVFRKHWPHKEGTPYPSQRDIAAEITVALDLKPGKGGSPNRIAEKLAAMIRPESAVAGDRRAQQKRHHHD